MKTDVLRLHLIALMISCLAVLVCGQEALASSSISLSEDLVSAANATVDEVNRSSTALPQKSGDQNQPMGSAAATNSPFSLPDNKQQTGEQLPSSKPGFDQPGNNRDQRQPMGGATTTNSPFSLPDNKQQTDGQLPSSKPGFDQPENNRDQNQPMGGTTATNSPFSPPDNEQQAGGQSLSSEPEAPDAEKLLAKGIELARKNRWGEAGQAFEAATEADRGNAAAWCNLGLAYSRFRKTQKALAAYEQALQADPGFALAYKNLALALEHTGQYAKAVNSYEQYLRLKPNAEDARRVRARANWLKKNKVK